MFFITKVGHSVGQQRCEVFVLKGIKLLVISVKEGLMTCSEGLGMGGEVKVWVLYGFSFNFITNNLLPSTAKKTSKKGTFPILFRN